MVGPVLLFLIGFVHGALAGAPTLPMVVNDGGWLLRPRPTGSVPKTAPAYHLLAAGCFGGVNAFLVVLGLVLTPPSVSLSQVASAAPWVYQVSRVVVVQAGVVGLLGVAIVLADLLGGHRKATASPAEYRLVVAFSAAVWVIALGGLTVLTIA